MGNHRERPLKELYDATRKISEPEITPVLQGTCRIQGPICEAVYDLRGTNSGYFPVEERRLLVNEKLRSRAESGTCNVCSAPCTSCLHLKRTMPLMESKIKDGLSHNTSGRKEDDSCSFFGGKGPNYKGRECDDQQHASNETSNLLSSTSSYDSCFENCESKAQLRVSVTDGASEDVKIPPPESSDEAVKLLLEQTTVTAHNSFPSDSQTTSDLPHQTLSGLVDEHHVLEYHGDNVSCISVVEDKDTDTAVHAPCTDSENTNSTSRIPSNGNLLARKDEKPVQTEALHDHHIDEIKEIQNDFKRPGTCLEVSLPKNSGSSFANVGSYPKSEHSEFHPSKSDNSSFHDSFFKERNACSQLPAEILKCYVANEESSLAGELAAGSVDGQENTALANSDINKASSITSEPTSVSLNDTDDARKCSFMKEPSPKSSSLLETANMEVSKTQPQTTSDSENSAEIEDDVKVCDICGDAGQEELLAICSRCSDGAEHIYCMRVMLDKLPEGDWLCEECQLKEETENQKVDKSEAASEMLEIPCLNEKAQSSGNTFNPEVLPNLETKEINSDAKGGVKGLQSTQDSTKRHGITSPRKNTVWSRESSFNSLDVGKVKPVNPLPSCGVQSRSGSQPIAHSQASLGSNSSKIEAQFESTRGLLSKSASFNSSKMPKVKQLIESVPLRQKITSSSDSKKEGLLKTFTKSASFKSTNSGCNTESANKIQSLDPLRAEEPRGGKLVKERNVINKKNSSVSDRPSISPSLSASTSSPFTKVDIKFPQHVGKSNKIPDLSNVGTDRGSNNANNLGCKEVKKQSSFSSRTSGSTPSNGLRKSEDQKTYQPVSKENACASSAAVDRACCNPDSIQQCSTPQVAESTHRDDTTKDHTLSSSLRQAASGSSRLLRCQRCNETGHTTQFCAVDKLRMSAVRPSAERNLREGSNRNSKWKDVVEAMSSKTRPLKNIKSPDQSVEISTSSADQNSQVTSKDFQSGSLRCPRNLPSMEETADGQEVFRSSADFSKAAVFHVKQKTSYQEETVCVPKDGNTNTILNISEKLNLKPQMQILPGQASVLEPPLRASVIPKLELIWQGGFKVLRTGGHSEICDGLQAHPSTCVSPKALEAAFKFPCIIHLEEVPRHGSWPSQFQKNSPKEDNIALFFFAKDIESYKNNYSKLLETMLKNDLALKGNVDGAELLIFPSNLLPENSQRWNNLFFLWGVFRERKEKSLDDMPVFQKLNRPNLNMEPLDQDLPAPIMSGVSLSHENPNKELSRSERSQKRKKVSSTSSVDFRDTSSSGIKDRACNAQEYSFVKPLHQEAIDNNMPLKLTSGSLPASSLGKNANCTCPESNLQMNSEQSYLGVHFGVTWLNNFSDNSDGREDSEHICHVQANSIQSSHDEDGVLPTFSVSSYCGQGTEIKQKNSFMNSESVLNDDSLDNLLEIDHVSSRHNRKPMQSNTMDKLSHVPGETILQNEEANCSINDEKESKKMKLDNGIFAGCSREEILSAKLSSKVHPLSSSFTNDSIHAETMPESSRSVVRNFFPVDSGPIRGKRAEDFIYLSSDDEDLPESNAPDLKLALGGKKKSLGQDILPLFPPKVGEKSNQDKPPGPAVVDGDDVSASLSLSLASPALVKEQTSKSVSKTGQMMPEKPGANTSFFFFHGFTDT
ncbi:uncharacterized protein LOC103714039 isoform X2 [Phoenix dactylifera]|uniref:Uncharacterized protein LOC103714039 isoform X2 n=1 Tax=Phoenix dactylifera TaxID=42345 RepID=A0A8B8ZG89_PHODC|nr:uncharacterized protein LOC103714039 isoform X2 [Phoenix dactylifera]